MATSKLLLLALPLALFACAATTDDLGEDGLDQDAETSEDELKKTTDVSADFVGDYRTPSSSAVGDVASLRLRKDRTFVLVQGGKTEEGRFVVRKGATAEAELRLTLASGAGKTFKVTLGAEPFRSKLTITRSRKTSVLERQLLSCESVNCTTGFGCDVVETDGVPGPVCSARTPAWKLALGSYDLWGTSFDQVIPGNYMRSGLGCGVTVSTSTIRCGTVGWDGWSVAAPIAADGTFLTGVATGDENYLEGSIAADGQVTLKAWRKKECYSVPSGRFCDGKATDRGATQKPYEMCRTPDQTFGQGGWASGYYTKCSACTTTMGCSRFPAK